MTAGTQDRAEVRVFGAIATECATEHRERWKREPGTGARPEAAPETVEEPA